MLVLPAWYEGVHNEVVKADCYRLSELDFVPKVILDVGANIGAFANHAHKIFPRAKIVCVEPDEANFSLLCRNAPKRAKLIKAAIGKEQVWEIGGTDIGCHRRFVSPGVAYSKDAVSGWTKRGDLEVIRICTLINEYADGKSILKIDIEGNEDSIFSDFQSMKAMLDMEYVAIEVHKFADGKRVERLAKETEKALSRFNKTHDVSWNESNFLARRKQ